MKKLWIVLLLLPLTIKAQLISTIAGNGSGGDGSVAISALITDPNGLVVDKYGNVYFSENTGNKIRKIDTSGIITTIAGTGAAGFSGDSSLATVAKLNQPDGIAFDSSGNLFIADGGNNRIRKIDLTTGVIITVVGNGVSAFAGDSGLATDASLNHPGCVCFDKYGNMYIGDYGNKRVRKVIYTGFIYTIAGNGMLGWSGDGGPATAAKCNPFNSMCTDDIGDLFIAEWGSYVVRKIDTTGTISTVAGNTSYYVYNGDGIPATAASLAPEYVSFDDSGNLCISDSYNNRVRKIDHYGIIHSIVGTGAAGNTGDNGLATLAETDNPSGCAFDLCGNLYFAQVNIPRIRKITFDTSCSRSGGDTSLSVISIIPTTISIFPNPATTQLTIQSTAQPIAQITIINLLGQTVYSQLPTVNCKLLTVDVSTFPAAMYFVKINDSEVRKFLKE